MKIKKLAFFFCTGFGIGYFSKAPGTLASLMILPFIWVIKPQISTLFLVISLIIYFIISYLFLKVILTDKTNMDPKYIVCDEYLGQSIALIFCNQEYLDFFIAFICFRILDIKKPFPISYFDEKKNISGVLMDDVIAGLTVSIIFLVYYAF